MGDGSIVAIACLYGAVFRSQVWQPGILIETVKWDKKLLLKANSLHIPEAYDNFVQRDTKG